MEASIKYSNVGQSRSFTHMGLHLQRIWKPQGPITVIGPFIHKFNDPARSLESPTTLMMMSALEKSNFSSGKMTSANNGANLCMLTKTSTYPRKYNPLPTWHLCSSPLVSPHVPLIQAQRSNNNH